MNLPQLKVVNISKNYGNNWANRNINLQIFSGEIQALLGENGAGKSTLMKVIYGLIQPDTGEIFWEGKIVNLDSPAQAINLGIGMVFQHFSLFETLTVTENIALAMPKTEKWNLSRLANRISNLSQKYGLSINPDRPIHTLSVGEKQRVEIVRCLAQNAKLLILDEPTAVLTPQEVETLFASVRQLAAEGCSVLFSSHKLGEVQSLCSSATVLRSGEVVASCNPQVESPASLARLMVGTNLSTSKQRTEQVPGAVLLEVENLSLPPQNPYGIPLRQINLQVRVGEIVGIAGVAGNGQSELLAAVSGEVLCAPESIKLGELPIGNCGVTRRRRLGLAYVPQERMGKGTVPNLSLQENALLTGYGQGLLRRGIVRQPKLQAWTKRICDLFAVKSAGLEATAGSLSGGNLQKFILGREMLQNPAVLIAAHPTWGVDVKATQQIHDALLEMRNAGAGILMVAEDVDELFELCDRICVIYQGHLSPLVPINQTNREQMGRWIGGIE